MAILQQSFQVPTLVTAGSFTNSVELPGLYVYVYLIIGNMTQFNKGTQILINGSEDNVNFKKYSNPESNTNSVGVNDFTIISSVSQRIVYLPNFDFRYARIEFKGASVITTPAGPAFSFVCVSNQ